MTAPWQAQPVALVLLTASALPTARRAAAALRDAGIEAELHGLETRLPEGELAVSFPAVSAHLQGLFAEGRAILGLCAAGVLIRALAPLLADKWLEPPVLALAEDGSAVVPLLGGHRGGNRLAGLLAEALGGVAAVTTAGDLRLGFALDDPPSGWVLANPQDAGAVAAALLAGERAQLTGDGMGEATFLSQAGLPLAANGAVTLAAGLAPVPAEPLALAYHPLRLALGVGCARGCPAEELAQLARAALAEAGVAAEAVAAVVSVDLKADEPAMHALAAALGRPARFFPPERLEAETPRLATPSEVVFAEIGCHGVAEGAALAAVGPDGVLLLPKRKSANATCAIALAPAPFDGRSVGAPQGRLDVVGLGPGSALWRTPEAETALRSAEDLVGYGLYLDLTGAAAHGRRHPFPLGAETERVAFALDLAATGRQVALVSSGDPGIYAMAALVYEQLARDDAPAGWGRVAITVMPGISALQAAAARAGAPLGHDFCAISLSDLLTPAEVIETRIAAAAAGDFVIAFYNPVSVRRRVLLHKAKAMLLAQRPAETPVVVARNLGRADEAVVITTLAALDPEAVDMLSIVLIGASQTRRLQLRHGEEAVFTPRGYAGKRQ